MVLERGLGELLLPMVYYGSPFRIDTGEVLLEHHESVRLRAIEGVVGKKETVMDLAGVSCCFSIESRGGKTRRDTTRCMSTDSPALPLAVSFAAYCE